MDDNRRRGIDVTVAFSALRITMDGVLHLHVDRSKLLGVASWVSPRAWCIEYTLEGGTMLTEYDSQDKFETILRRLAEVL